MRTTLKQQRTRFIFGAIVIAACASTSAADIFRVPGDFPTISAAMAKASDFDVIMVDPGKYDGFIWGNKLVTVQAIMGPRFTYIVGGVIFEPAIKGAYRTLDGFTVTGAKEGLYFMPNGGGHVLNCISVNNDGSGIHVLNAELYIENSLLANNNRAQYNGCGLLNEGGVVHGVNLTVVGNIGTHSAGVCDYSPLGQSTYANCVVWNNGPSAIAGNARFSFCNTEEWVEGVGNMCADPCFADPLALNFALRPGSPCIDAGNSDAVPWYVTTDLAGNARFQDDPFTKDFGQGRFPIVDIGAFEFRVPFGAVRITP